MDQEKKTVRKMATPRPSPKKGKVVLARSDRRKYGAECMDGQRDDRTEGGKKRQTVKRMKTLTEEWINVRTKGKTDKVCGRDDE